MFSFRAFRNEFNLDLQMNEKTLLKLSVRDKITPKIAIKIDLFPNKTIKLELSNNTKPITKELIKSHHLKVNQ